METLKLVCVWVGRMVPAGEGEKGHQLWQLRLWKSCVIPVTFG